MSDNKLLLYTINGEKWITEYLTIAVDVEKWLMTVVQALVLESEW